MHYKKAQLKMFETIGVLIVFFILLGIGMSVYFAVQKSSYAKDTVQRRQLEALNVAQKMIYLPELDCILLHTSQDVCFDKLKFDALQKLLQENAVAKTEYFKLFGYATITLHFVYPSSAATLVLYNKQLPNGVSIAMQSPVLIKDPIQDINSFGYVEVKRYFPA